MIEDNPDTAETLRMSLELDGHTVEIAADGEEGVAKALAFQPDIVRRAAKRTRNKPAP